MTKKSRIKTQKRVYLDHAATTPISASVALAMKPFMGDIFANPGALHSDGVLAKKSLLLAREKIALALNVQSGEIVFTSGGTESDNIAIQGVIRKAKSLGTRRPHIVTTSFEHSAVLETAKALEKDGVMVTFVKPNKDGIINPENIAKAIRPETILVSVMYAQNEIGTIQPIREISLILKKEKEKRGTKYPIFHVDACQAPNYLDLTVHTLGADLFSISGSKIYGPKGSGILFVKRGTPIEPIFYGGSQEGGLRPGTEPVYLYIGLAQALHESHEMRKKESERLTKLRDYFIEKLLFISSRIHLNGHPHKRLPNIVNVSVDGIDNEFFVIQLDEARISVSTRSACKTDDENGSHVIISLGKTEKEAKESIRFSFGRSTTKKDLDYTIKTINKLLEANN